jgi:MOSC domain-containing protein YiiM
MESVREIRAQSGQGLEGDRYFKQAGTFSKKGEPDREITLIEIEAIEALQNEKGVKLDPGASRRNIVTRGVPLNHLVGLEFSAGEVKLRGLRLCEPCSHLAKLTHKEVLPGLVHRGGLRAQILTGGTIRVADPVQGL